MQFSEWMERRLGSSVQTIDFEYGEILLFLIHSHSLSSQLDAVLLCWKTLQSYPKSQAQPWLLEMIFYVFDRGHWIQG